MFSDLLILKIADKACFCFEKICYNAITTEPAKYVYYRLLSRAITSGLIPTKN